MHFQNLLKTAWRTFSTQSPRPAVKKYRFRAETQLTAILSCPPPTNCPCAEMPSEFSNGLTIDHEAPLEGSMPSYSKQLLICTGTSTWPSKIELGNEGCNLAADVKELVGRGGKYSDPYNQVMITNTSFPPSPNPSHVLATVRSASAFVLPAFKYIPFLPPLLGYDRVHSLVQGFLLPSELHPSHNELSPTQREGLLRKESEAHRLGAVDVKDILVLICGHGGRDARCGTLGPILEKEFKRILRLRSFTIGEEPPELVYENPLKINNNIGFIYTPDAAARVGLTSHVGGHKFAGLVTVAIPPKTRSPLAGCSIWYGRVTPSHVEGIVRETIIAGRVIKELFRGGLKPSGEILRLKDCIIAEPSDTQ